MATTTIVTKSTKRISISQNPTSGPRKFSPERLNGVIWFWSILEATIITLFTNNWVRWVQSSDFVHSNPGPDPYPYLYILRGTEFLGCAVFVYPGNRTPVPPWLQNGVPSLDGKTFLGGAFASTLDIMSAAFNLTWAMNAYGYAFGSWANFIPGFPGLGASEVPWGMPWCLSAYIWLGVGAAILGCSILGKLRQTFRRMSTVAMYSFA